MDNKHALNNRLNAEQIGVVLPLVVEQYPFYCHVAAMRSSNLNAEV